jgi:mannosyl-oligosaccharide glucosidase
MQAIIKFAQVVVEPYHNSERPGPEPAFALQLPNEAFTGSNLHALQKSFDGPFQFDIFFESESAKHKLSSSTLDEGIPALSASFASRFAKTFPLPLDTPEAKVNFSKEVTANVLGGVGYFYGTSIVDPGFAREWDQDESGDEDSEKPRAGAHLTEPRALLTATPSRSFFPRGFYWDEGFHLLHIGEWDNALRYRLSLLKNY